MKIEDCYEIGHVVKPHGLKGEVTVSLDVDYPEEYAEMESVFVCRHGSKSLVPFFIEHFKLRGSKGELKFEDVDAISTAETLKGARLYLPEDTLPDLGDDGYYYHELVGMMAVAADTGKPLGPISTVYDVSANPLMGVEVEGKEVLIPMADHVMAGVDKTARQVQVNLPDGLLDIYLNEDGGQGQAPGPDERD